MFLNKSNLYTIECETLRKPTVAMLHFPEKVLQFGTGVLLRGLPAYFIDQANSKGIFKGRVVVVKSTSQGDLKSFISQDNLYTLCVEGIQNGEITQQYEINASISRVLSANEQWAEVLATVEQESLEIIISNTTEVGIQKVSEPMFSQVPTSFPGKLLRLLHHRYTYFSGALDKGMVILPTELITNNADMLKAIVLELAAEEELDDAFISWLSEANYFCNTLVDRIVPGKLSALTQQDRAQKLGYNDSLMIMAEPFRLWAIETSSPKVRSILSFSQADEGVKIVGDIHKFKELKLRLLNGTHSLCCAYALYNGFDTVREAMENADFRAFIQTLMFEEIAVAIESEELSARECKEFAESVIDRFSNPFLAHRWASITLNYSSKMHLRTVAILKSYVARKGSLPTKFVQGFAAYIQFMCSQKEGANYFAVVRGNMIPLQDEQAAKFYNYWKSPATVVTNVLGDSSLWGEDLTRIAGLVEAIELALKEFQK